MRFIYKPNGTEEHQWRSWPFEPDKMLNSEAEEIERRTGMTFGEWVEAIEKNSMRALHGLLFAMLKRDEPTTTWGSVEFSMSEVEIEFDVEDKKRFLADISEKVADGVIPADEARPILDALRAEIAEVEGPADEDVEAPKDESNSPLSGSGTLPTTSTSIPLTSVV